MWRKEEGQSLVEFALVLPMIIIMLVAVVDFGRVLYTQQQLELVTQEAVRIASFGEDDAEIESYVENNFSAGESSDLSVTVTPGDRTSGDYVTVEVSYPESILSLLGDRAFSYEIETSSTIRVE